MDIEGDALWKNAGEVGSDATAGDVTHRVHGRTEVAFEQRVKDAGVQGGWLKKFFAQ